MWQYTPYTMPLVVLSLISFVVGIYIGFHFHTPRSRVGSLAMLASAEWMVAYALELASADLLSKIFWDKIQFLGIVVIPAAWFVYALYYTGYEKWLTRRTLLFLFFIPFITLALVFTNETHGLIWTSYVLDTTGLFTVLYNPWGLWMWIFLIYSYILVALAFSVVIKMFIHSHSLYRLQTSALLFGVSVSLVASVLFALEMNPFPHVDIIPFGLFVTNLTVAFSIIYFRLGEIVPLAREIVVEGMSDSVVIIDAHDCIVDANPSAHQLMRTGTLPLIGNTVTQVLPELASQIEGSTTNTGGEILLDGGDEQRVYDVSISPLTDWRKNSVGQVIVLRDVTDRKRSEKIKQSLLEKEILLQETHHRVKNNMQIISSLLNLQSTYIKDRTCTKILKDSQNRIRAMALVHEKLYSSDNLANINFNEYVTALTQNLFHSYGVNTGRIKLKLETEKIPFDIDTAIPCGLIINELVSNAIKHAFPDGKEGEIVITLRSRDEIIDLIISDNGIGIPDTIDFRTTQSLGLHLVTILAEDQLDGAIVLDRTAGTAFQITFNRQQYFKD
jgi:two-component sensor histidine kinase